MRYQLLLYSQERLRAEYWVNQLFSENWRTNLVQFDSTILTLAETQKCDLLILDEDDSVLDNLDLLKSLRSKSVLPIMIISGSEGEEDRTRYYETGADDVVHERIGEREFHARIAALLRRNNEFKQVTEYHILECGDIRIDPNSWTASCQGKMLNLTSREFTILAMLMQSPEKLVHKQILSQKVLLSNHSQPERGLDAHICNIRKKIGYITPIEKLKTIRGEGYILLNNTHQ